MRWQRYALWGAAIYIVLMGLWFRYELANNSHWLQEVDDGKGPYLAVFQVEADAYTRLTRIQRILDGKGLIQNWHPHENFPEGMAPTTTLPMDAAILALVPPASLFSETPVDWAGALISPLLYLLLAGYLCFWARGVLKPGALLLLLLGVAMLPNVAWATCFARPDHQSLILLLLAIALSGEWKRWDEANRFRRLWAVTTGIAWGLAGWTSLFEPALFFIIVLLGNLIGRRREQWEMLAAFGFVALLFFLIEGFHITGIAAEHQPYLLRWFEQIGELRPMISGDFGQIFKQVNLLFSPILWLAPLFFIRLYMRLDLRTSDHLLTVLTILLLILSLNQVRWGMYGGFTLMLVAAFWVQRESTAWLRWTGAGLTAIAILWAARENVVIGRDQPVPPTADLRRLAKGMNYEGAIMAPWWQAPVLMYYSGLPIVASSSHVTIAGIIDSANFYSTKSWTEANDILQKRGVRWVVVWRPEFLVPNSLNILGETAPPKQQLHVHELPVAYRLAMQAAVPTRFRLRSPILQDFRLYEVTPAR